MTIRYGITLAARNRSHLLAAVAIAGIASPAFAQYCGQWDPDNPGCWQQQRDEEDKRRRDAEEEARKRDEAYREQQEREAEAAEQMRQSEPQRREAARQSAEYEATLNELRANLLAMPPLPADRNPLLGRWQVAGSDKPPPKDDLAQLQELLTNPGGAMCTVVFGEGVTEFLPASWAAIDSYGNDSLGNIQYRMNDGRAFALPDQGLPLLGFEIVDKNRIREIRLPECELVRVGAATKAAPAATAKAAPPTSAPAATAAVATAGAAATATTAAANPSARRPAPTPIDPNTPLGRGVRLHAEKEFQPALQQLLGAEQANPNDPRVYVYLADTYAWLGMQAEAEQAATRAKQLDPNAFEILQ